MAFLCHALFAETLFAKGLLAENHRRLCPVGQTPGKVGIAMHVYLKGLAPDGVTIAWEPVAGTHSCRVLWTDRDTPAHIFKPLPPTAEKQFRFARSTHIPYYIKVEALAEDGTVLAESETVRTPVCHIQQPQLEEIGRGLIAVSTSDGVFLSWRLLRTEVNGYTKTGLAGADFVVYKNGSPAASVTDRTSWRDKAGTAADRYSVAAVYAGVEQLPCAEVRPWAQNYIDLPLRRPPDGITPTGEPFQYHANDMSVGDVDGDGEYEYIVKWDPSNSKDVSQRGYTGRCILDCYRLDGTLVWRLDMGPNIRAGAHYTQFMVYDFNGDGKAEMAVKTAPGTKMTRFAPDGTVLSERYITMPQADQEAGYAHSDNYVCSAASYREHLIDVFMGWDHHPEVVAGHWFQTLEECFAIPWQYVYPLCREDAEELVDYFIQEFAPSRSDRNRLDQFEGFIYEGPEYLTMFSGMGEELETIPYKPERGDDGLIWGDYACPRIEPCNRVDRFLAGVAYLDGERPYLIVCRGYYTRACVVAYDFFENRFHEVWCADSGHVVMDNPFNCHHWAESGSNPLWGALAGQGNHSLSAADVDGDGYMEIVYGAAVIDHDGSMLYSAKGTLPDGRIVKLGHGDSMHVADIDPDRPGKEIFNVFEEGKNAPYGYALRDAETGETYFGEYFEGDLGRCMVGDMVDGVRGLQVWVNDVFDCKGRRLDASAPSTNMRIYWAGDLTTQVTDGADYLGEHAKGLQTGRVCDLRRGILLHPAGTLTNNGTKGNPCLVADIFGDYREELLLRLVDSSAIRIYTSIEDAPHKLFTLMHDPQYRCGVAWQNNCYNQPVYPSFYYASDMRFKDVLPAQEFRPTLYLAGDSTMQAYEESETLWGWGQALPIWAKGAALCIQGCREDCPYPQEKLYTLPELVVDNCAMGGRSSRSFIEEGRLDDIAAHLRQGDYLLVQFGHNDAAADCPERYTAPEAFANSLQRYAKAATEKGAQLILVTPLPALHRKFPPAAYREEMLAFARKKDIPCVDLGKAFAAACLRMGGRAAVLYQLDGVHLTRAGAERAVETFVQLLCVNRDTRLTLLRTVFGGRKPGQE